MSINQFKNDVSITNSDKYKSILSVKYNYAILY